MVIPIMTKMQKYIILSILFMLLFFSLSVHAEPSLLWKKEFDSRIVKTSRLMDFQVVKGKGGDFPLKAVMTEKSIFVLDNKGKFEKRISLKDYDKAAMSDDGTTIALMKGKEITVSDLDNQIKGTVKIQDSQPVILPQHISFELSCNGKYLVIISYFTNTIYFHNSKGELLFGHTFDDLKSASIKFSGDSRYTGIHIPNRGKGNSIGFLVFFNDKGEKLWKIDHKGCEASFDISDNGEYVGMAANDRFYSLNNAGEVVYEKELVPGEIDIQLSPDGKYLVMAQKTEHLVSFIDNENGNILWSKQIDGFDPLNSPFTALDISGTEAVTAVAISRDWTKQNKESSFFVFNKSGNLLWNNVFEESKTEGMVSPDGKSILIAGNINIWLFLEN